MLLARRAHLVHGVVRPMVFLVATPTAVAAEVSYERDDRFSLPFSALWVNPVKSQSMFWLP